MKLENKNTTEIAEAIFIINKHAKTATNPRDLYSLKTSAINKLLKEKKAQKIGLHFSKNPKNSHQHSTLLIKVTDYFFHIPPKKEDFDNLEHLGHLDETYRNPQPRMSLNYAKKIIYSYVNYKPKKKKKRSNYYTPSALGKMEWPPTKKF